MSLPNGDPEHAVSKIFTSAIAAAAIPAAWEVGLLDAVKENGEVNVSKFAAAHDLHADSILGLVTTMTFVDVLEYSHGAATAGKLFDETFKMKSFFHWLTLGSGGLFSRTQYLVRNQNRIGNYYRRDPAAIAYACRELNHQFWDPLFWNVMKGLEFRTVVDLGCGSGERLMQILERRPGTSAIGIDIAGPAIDFAKAEAQKRGFGDRLSFAMGDARSLEYREIFAEVDLLTCFLMGHDFWPRDACITTLRTLRKTFPKLQRFLLGDSTRGILHSEGSDPPTQVTKENVPIFPLGLELGHVLMNVYIPTMEDWYGVFEEAGWRCVDAHELHQPAFAVIFELEPLERAVNGSTTVS